MPWWASFSGGESQKTACLQTCDQCLPEVTSKEAGLIVALHNQVRARVARGEEGRGRCFITFPKFYGSTFAFIGGGKDGSRAIFHQIVRGVGGGCLICWTRERFSDKTISLGRAPNLEQVT